MIGPLARLAARRTAPPSTWAVVAATAAALVWSSRGAAPSGAVAAGAFDALARREAWAALGAVACVLTTHGAATLARDWRRRDADAFGGTPRSRRDVAFSSWLGAWFAAAALVAAIAVFAEAWTRAGQLAEIELGCAPITSSAGPYDELRLRTEIDPPSGAEWIELELGFIATDVVAPIELRATRGADSRSVRALVSSRTRLRVASPDGRGPLTLELRRTGPGGVVYLGSDEAAFLGAPASARRSSVVLALHFALAAAAWTAIAFALAARLGPMLATLSAFALAVPAWAGESAWWNLATPWGGLPAALEVAGRGSIPAPPGWTVVVSAVFAIAASLTFAARALRTWRSAR